MSKAVILLNMGAARSAWELRTFLFNMFMDRRIINSPIRYFLAPLISLTRYKRVWKKYELIGGSRLYDLTENLAAKMQDRLNYDVVYAMKYTRPFLSESITKYQEVILLPLYPQYSTTTVESSLDELKKTNFKGKLSIVPPFYLSDAYNTLIVNQINNEIKNQTEKHLIFSAHGLPQKIVDNGDPYQKQLEAQVQKLKSMLPGFKSIRLAYQSRFGNSPWLQPYLDDVLPEFANEKIVLYPISFMIDNSETDLELKIEYAETAEKHHVKSFEVVSCPNDAKETVNFLVNLIKSYDTSF